MDSSKPLYEFAYVDYQNGMKYKDIAAKYDVSIDTVKKWKTRHKWVKPTVHKKCTQKDKSVHKKKVGAPAGNKNAVGNSGGAPKGSQNNLRHGAYKEVSWDVLEDEDEEILIENIDYTPIEILKSNYKNLLLRERRLLKEIVKVKKESDTNRKLILGSVTKIHASDGDGEENKTITVAEATFNALRIYEAELTRIQAQKTNLAVKLEKMTGGNQKSIEDLRTIAEMLRDENN